MTGDPVGDAIARALTGVPEADRAQVRDDLRDGLISIGPTVAPDDLAIEVDAAMAVAPIERPAAAVRFAEHHRATALGRRSWELLTRFSRGDDVVDATAALLEDIRTTIDGTRDDATRRDLGSYATECRFILSGGTGANSLRGSKLA